jgi:hypothetical protein
LLGLGSDFNNQLTSYRDKMPSPWLYGNLAGIAFPGTHWGNRQNSHAKQYLDICTTLNPRWEMRFFTKLQKCARSQSFAAPPPVPPLFVPFAENIMIQPTNFIGELRVGCPTRLSLG